MNKQEIVLIVDDRAEDRDLLSEILEEAGFRVVVEHDGKDAIQLLKTGALRPNVILMDMSMTGISGHTAFNIIRSDEEFNDIPFIFVSGREKTQDLLEAQSADDFILKPYEPKNLISRIRKAIARKAI